MAWHGGDTEVGIRAAETPEGSARYDRYRVGLNHLAFGAESRAAVGRFHEFLQRHDVEVLDPPADYPRYEPDYCAVFFADSDGIKLELVHRAWNWYCLDRGSRVSTTAAISDAKMPSRYRCFSMQRRTPLVVSGPTSQQFFGTAH